ncbi:adenylate kinase isoenzyme 1 [Eurytemora carolleeae]|uniref:adenylate kinase isoenzyme 1 n=1 Tax=Eurytemora carolleeae TaxID=1294199 RepID=UPI000C7780FB|nr:adenylate kinase isoenzyme 1 [Eurytemora carolleeae]|eukprot:XP_023342847.1 adenylate kinase isoenzyme 1-like [Eurytemora affinis]
MEIERKEINVASLKSANLPIYWVLGGPGSGKGTQCTNVGAKTGFSHFSSGDLLRNDVLSGSRRGLQLFRMMELGELVPTVSNFGSPWATHAFVIFNLNTSRFSLYFNKS